MSKLVLHNGLWIAVCDGRKAFLLENKGDSEYPKLETRETFEQENPSTHAQGSAAPGRSFSSMGNRRSSVEESDFHDQAEQTFLHTFAEHLDRYGRDHHIRSLVLIAPARALGMIRPALSAATRQVLVAEIDKDYVKLPLHEIERHLMRLDSH
jgi:protein required for attachment to host cells